MNILVFSAVKIYPADAGSRIRIYNFIKHLKKLGHSVHYVYYSEHGLDKKHFDFMIDFCDSFNVIVKNKKIKPKTGNYDLDEWYDERISNKINDLIPLLKIDTVVCNYIFYSKFLDSLPKNITKIIDTHDKFTDRYKLFENHKDIKYTWHSYSKEDETKALNRADIILSITDEEKYYFSKICNKKIMTLGHIEEKKYLTNLNNKLEYIGFIGGQNHVNIVAINNFLKEFLKSKINTEIVIAGKICEFINFKDERIILLGMIDNLDEFYKKVDLIINPLTFGTGQKIKTIEALSYGLPILSTKIGFDGIFSKFYYHNLVSIEEIIEQIKDIKEDPTILSVMAKSSKDIFDEYELSINQKFKEIFGVIDEFKIKNENTLLKQNCRTEVYDILIRHQENKIKRLNKKLKNQNKIIEAVKSITKISFLNNPVKKYMQYKKIIKEYYENT